MKLFSLLKPLSSAALVSLAYLGCGVLWILLSDQLGEVLFSDASRITTYQTYKGWLFVCGTAVLFYLALRRFSRSDVVNPRAGGEAGTVPHNYSLQWLLTLLVFATAVPMVLMLVHNVRHEVKTETEKAGQQVRRLAELTAADAGGALAQYERIATYMASRPEVRALDPKRCGSRFEDLTQLHSDMANAGSVNLNGDAICSVLKTPGGKRPNIGNPPWLAELKRRNAFVVGAPQTGVYSGRQIVILAYPIRDGSGAPIGAMQLVINLSAFQPLVTASLPPGAVAGISDSESNLIARSYQPEGAVGGSYRGLGINPIVLEKREGTAIALGADGVERLYAFKPIGDYGWYAVAGLATEDAFAEGRKAIRLTVLLSFGVVMASLLLVLMIYRKIANPMRALTRTAERIVSGNFDERAVEGGPREVAQVARGFNQALNLVQESEARFRALTSLASDWYWETDAEHRFTVMSAGVNDGEMGGFDPTEFLGRTRWEAVDGRGMPDAQLDAYRALIERREPFHDFELARRDAGGRLRYALVSGEPVFDEAGEFKGYRGVGHSITARREAEAAVRRNEAHYRTLFDASPDALWVICEERVVMINPAGVRLFGLRSAEERLGRLVYEHVHHDYQEIVRQRLRQVLQERKPAPPSEQLLMRVDGSSVSVEIITVLFEYDDKPAALVIAHDLTERKTAELALQRLNAELEARVQQRTEALVQANRNLESFSYTVAHDLRAPLRSIGGFASLLEETNGARLDQDGREFMGRIKASASSMNQLIEGLLSLSRLGRAKLHPTRVDLSMLASAVVRELRERDPGRQVDCVVAPDVFANGDLHLLKNVLDNLIGNAWKFTAATPEARIEFGQASHGDGVAYFVRDNGAGFDAQYADKLFGAFQRLHTGDQFPGIGIGLASVRRIIDNHGGKVWGESAVGQGATFWFTLGTVSAT